MNKVEKKCLTLLHSQIEAKLKNESVLLCDLERWRCMLSNLLGLNDLFLRL